MSKVLRLYNTYSRSIREARLACGELITTPALGASPIHGTLYICGPTVYSESHLGHALTYMRADLFRRVLKSLFNVRLTTVMNITDVDDKILAKSKDELPPGTEPSTKPGDHPFTRVSERYYRSFVNDMSHIRVTPPDLTIKVSKSIDTITNYIKQLEKKGHAYLATNGDIYFRVSSIPNYQGRVDSREDNKIAGELKVDGRDFALWKAAKPHEPVWVYKSDVTGTEVLGRPGWHVQCSAISNAIFGDRLDFHFSGKDLIFPHNYNEQVCCCAYHGLDTSKDINVWSANWLHSGHLVLRDEKMSKSLGNVVGIKKFIDDSSVNALRLLCVGSHYRSDVNFNGDLLDKMKSLDHKLNAFASYLSDGMRISEENTIDSEVDADTNAIDMENHINRVHQDIIDGVCDDFDLSKGLISILDLSKVVYNAGFSNIRLRDLVIIRQLLLEWSSMCGLEYVATSDFNSIELVNLVRDFRQEIRDQVTAELKRRKQMTVSQIDDSDFLVSILRNCDHVRSRLDELGFVIRDNKTQS